MTRSAIIKRATKETNIELRLVLDGSGNSDINTGIPFFDHMLTLWSVHGFFDLCIKATGDLEVDGHHTVEDVGICLGLALKEALEDFSGIRRYGSASVPMEETLARVDLDLCKRPYLVFNALFPSSKVGNFDTELVEEFLRAVVINCGMTLHVNVPYGKNCHHISEAIFKAFGKATDRATQHDPRIHGPLSSKGTL